MRDESQVIQQILLFARNREDVRAVLMNGSRVNPNAPADPLQDYDVVFAAKDPWEFVRHPEWIRQFGELVMLQRNTLSERGAEWPIFLMQFTGGVRIDLQFIHLADAPLKAVSDSLTRVLLDKDGILPPLPPPGEQSYYTAPPGEEEFQNTVNSFWWCSANVAKGLWRGELSYVKMMFDVVVREDLLRLLRWYAGLLGGWKVNPGTAGKWLPRLLPAEIWDSYTRTFAGTADNELWEALFEAGRLARRLGTGLSESLGMDYPLGDDERMNVFLRQIRDLPKSAGHF